MRALLLAGLLACAAGLAADESPRPDFASYKALPFDRLAAFPYGLAGQDSVWGSPGTGFKQGAPKIPDDILAFNGAKAYVTGYMIPLDLMAGMVHSFALVRSRMSCCYGQAPKLNEWVLIDLPKGKHTYLAQDVPLDVYGTLEVGERKEHGQVIGIYHMVMDMMRIEQEPGQ
jgi:hypothetical protein